jgi:rhomboid family GlyGly-CTERM serine protease
VARGVRLNWRRSPARAWIAVGAVLMIGSLVATAMPRTIIDWQPSLAVREPWRWWTAAFVHFGPLHLAANLLATAVVIAWGTVARAPTATAVAWFVAWPLTHGALLAQPGLHHYGGLSGVLHAGVAVIAVWLLVHAAGTRRVIGALVLAGLAVKLLAEAPWRLELAPAADWGVAVAPLAHAAGAVAGLTLGAVAAWWVRIGSAR